MSEQWTQERPRWCPHTDCVFQRRAMDAMCGGELPESTEHDGGENTHRFCLNGAADDGGVFDLQVNATDLDWLRWIFDALDGKRTSWLSGRAEPTQATAGDKPEQKTNEELAASLKEKFGKVPKWFQRYASVPIGTRIMANRKKAGLTQIQLAARNGCRQSTISQIESGERNPSYGLAERLLESCGARLVVSREGDEPEGAREALKKIEKLASKYGPTREIWE
ncbi:hypothetical protein LCGC14_0820000, partial [marine sediment metagenome]